MAHRTGGAFSLLIIATCARATDLSPKSLKTCRRHDAIRPFCIAVALTRLNRF
jgi:hypothetical protein